MRVIDVVLILINLNWKKLVFKRNLKIQEIQRVVM